MCEEYKCLVLLGEILATLALIYGFHRTIVDELDGDWNKAVTVYLTQLGGIVTWAAFYGIYWVITQ